MDKIKIFNEYKSYCKNFQPAYIKDYCGIIVKDNLTPIKDVFSIDDSDVYHFLYYFLEKHFDKSLIFNENRENSYENDFDWFGMNYFTYSQIESMIGDIQQTILLLKNDFNNPQLNLLKEKYLKSYLLDECEHPLSDNIVSNMCNLKINYIISFYQTFINLITEMINNNSKAGVIPIEGL